MCKRAYVSPQNQILRIVAKTEIESEQFSRC